MKRTIQATHQKTKRTFKNNIKGNFTITPNEVINDPNLSWKALGIFTYLASKPDNWDFYMDEVKAHATDGITALRTGIKELEQFGYLIRKPRWCNENKKYSGWDWILTSPTLEQSNPMENLLGRKSIGLETYWVGNPEEYNKTDNNNTNNNNTNNISPEESGEGASGKELLKDRNKNYLPLAKHLSKSIQKEKNIHHPLPTLKKWADEIRKLHEINKVNPKRIKKALEWYRKNIGGQYIPVIESGVSLRSKFTKLEDAIKRQSKPRPTTSNRPTNAHYEPDYKHKKADIEI